MAFKPVTAQMARPEPSLSADKPDRFSLIGALRTAAPALGLGPSVVATVDALLSCLPPKRSHDVVFASNATLVLRRNGISDRTLRRHLAELIDAGLLRRNDSPNGKRYAKRDPERGVALHFGLDMAPLFAAFARLCAMAQARVIEQERTAFLRCKLRAAIARRIALDGESAVTLDAGRMLRRKVDPAALETILDLVGGPLVPEHVEAPAATLSASNGQNVRHQQSSEKELIDKESETAPLRLTALTEACPEAASYLAEPIASTLAVINHAKRLAPMIGIDKLCYEAAEKAKGALETALSIWVLLELQGQIHRIGAYFRAITQGSRSGSFDARKMIDKFLRQKVQAETHCPRTKSAALA